MPTAAQRQRAAALSQLIQNTSQSTDTTTSTATTSANPSSSAKKLTQSNAADADWEDGAFSDDDSDEDDAAFKMDGQDNWTQNFCATCDTLIEPGQGFFSKNDQSGCQQQSQPMHSPTSSTSRTPSSGLRSKSGTIKARPVSSDEAGVGPVKRANSAGRIHTVGANVATTTSSAFGPSKRTGSAGSRLNALSELRPTTKLHGDAKAKNNDGSSTGKRSPATSRRNSNVSSHSIGKDGTHSSGPSSPSGGNAALPRTKRTGLLGALTPAALRQQEELEAAKRKAPAALYCSERCSQIDEQRSSGLGELVYYLQQPSSPPNAGWHSGPSSYGAWSSRASNSNMAALLMTSAQPASSTYGALTPESECTCAECLDKHSASGTVPSGASDTTESSNSYQYGPRGHKQRTTSGRIVTPQNLYPPGVQASGVNDYFGAAAAAAHNANAVKRGQQPTRAHLQHRDSISQAGTESSTRSSDSGSDLWEPRSRVVRPQNSRDRARSSSTDLNTSTPDNGRGSTTTGTVTPDGVYGSALEASHLLGVHNLPARRPSGAGASSVDVPLASSQASTASPLRLLRRGNHSGVASVDVTADVATSPQPYASSLLGRSMASERTEGAESSGFTTVAAVQLPTSSGTASERATSQSKYVSSDDYEIRAPTIALPDRITESPAPFERSNPEQLTASAIRTLKHAQARAAGHGKAASSTSAEERRQSHGSGEHSVSSTNSGWLRNSLSAAWNSIRGTGPSPNDEQAPPTTQQGQLQRPSSTRGDVPAYASEIGHGGIPGERQEQPLPADEEDGQSPKTVASRPSAPEQKSVGDLAAERRLRKAERERAHRHQRSKDVSILPPLLGVARPASSANLHHIIHPAATRTHRTHSTTSSRSDATAPDSPLLMPVRSTTPGFHRGHRNNSLVGLQDFGTSPGRLPHASIGSFGTSPRRAGLGWGALTPLGAAGAAAIDHRNGGGRGPALHAPGHRSNHHVVHPVAGPGAHHHHHHHQANHHHHSGHHHGHHRPQSGMVSLGGNIGVLGNHPHGNAAIVGRHATTPVRMSTPRVPEHGGEMSGAQLKGEEWEGVEESRHYSGTQSRSFTRRSTLASGHPTRPQSVNQMRPPSRSHTPSNAGPYGSHRGSYGEDGAWPGMPPTKKMYPVLDLPNRQPTHDRYDAGWGLGNDGLGDLLSSDQIGGEVVTAAVHNKQASGGQDFDGNQQTRKKLFYFDTT